MVGAARGLSRRPTSSQQPRAAGVGVSGRSCGRLGGVLTGVAFVALLASCVAAPKLAPAAAAAGVGGPAATAASVAPEAPAASSVKAIAPRVEVTGAQGRSLGRQERESLLRQLGQQGSATLLQRHVAAMAAVGETGFFSGNDVQLLIDGPATFAALFKAIESARSSVLVETYIVDDAAIAQRLAEALIRKRAQGVQVALLYDAVGSIRTDDRYFQALQDAGVLTCAFNPVNPAAQRKTSQSITHRDHRKIVTVDREVAFTGGINISAAYSSGSFGRGGRATDPARDGTDTGWRDTHVQIRGPAATAFDDLVRETWREQGCEGELAAVPARAAPRSAGKDVVRLVPASPEDEYSRIYTLMLTAIDAAQRSIYVTMAYFAPGTEIVQALADAARRGVDVQLVLPSRSDFAPALHAGRSHYDTLLGAGVRIFELQGAVLHAKTAVVDGVFSTAGSSNLDYRSFAGNNEINAVVLGEDFGDAMTRMFRQDLAASQEVTVQAWRSRSIWQRMKEGAARAFERWW